MTITMQAGNVEANINTQRSAYGAAADPALTSDAMRAIALKHCVSYEVWPEWSASGGRATRIGFAISLCGIHENGAASQDIPGSPRCWRTYAELRTVAEWILPEQERACRFEIEAFDRAWHVAPNARRGRNETVVTIKIFHRHNIHAPIDDCQQQCLHEMRDRLDMLGVRENVWAG
jgi:hypothetical protein